MIKFKERGNFDKTINYLGRIKKPIKIEELYKYGEEGVAALSSVTPVDTGLTANSWYYEVTDSNGSARITFFNSNIQNGVPIAVILQYGHATGNGGFVDGIDYINPAMRPIFEKIANNAWREVTKS